MLRDKETSKQTGMMPVASPTKFRKSCSSVPENDTVRKDLHNKEYEIVRLDELVPQGHILRRIDAAADFSLIPDLCRSIHPLICNDLQSRKR